jgi:hypothetical protein
MQDLLDLSDCGRHIAIFDSLVFSQPAEGLKEIVNVLGLPRPIVLP